MIDAVLKSLGVKSLDRILLRKEESWEVLLNSFLAKNTDCFFNLKSNTLNEEKISKNTAVELINSFFEKASEENFEVMLEVWKAFEKKGTLFSKAPSLPVASYWIEATGEERTEKKDFVRLSYHFEILERNKTSDKFVLSVAELKELFLIIISLEKKMKSSLELQWGKIGNEWWLVDFKVVSDSLIHLKTYVDSNLSENYSGVTSPLSFSLVKNIYTQVLIEAAKTMNFSGARFKHLEKSFPSLVNHIDWHLYYDIESYYTVLGNLPFGEKSIKEWHEKIGGEVYHYNSGDYVLRYGKIEILQTIWGMFRIIFKQEQVFTGFLSSLKDQKNEIVEEIDRVISPEQGWQLLERLMKRPMGLGLIVINDLFIVTGLRLLTKVLLKKGYKKSDLPLLLKTDLELQALRPIEALNHLKRKMTQKSWDILVQESVNENWEEPYKFIYQKLRDNGEGDFARELEKFITHHGEKSFEEFKLESLCFSQNPRLLVRLLDSFYGDKNPYLDISTKPVAIVLNPWQKWVLQFTRRSLDWREMTRQKRGELYHQLRKLVVKTASLMRGNESLFKQLELRDFFSLTMDEWISWSKKDISSEKVIDLMKEREVWKQLERTYPEIYFQAEEEAYYHYQIKRDKTDVVRGIGASPGEVSGTVLVLQHPEEAFMIKDLEERILVTKNTDPAWVYIMVRAKGLVAEKGSVLGDAAIIGRELKMATIVSASHITEIVRTGDKITINGTSGEVFINGR